MEVKVKKCIDCGKVETPKWYSGPKCRICYRKIWDKKYKSKDPERWKKYHRDYMRNRAKNDKNFKIAADLRSRLTHAVSGKYKSGSAIKDLGCSLSTFVKYIESKFQSYMTWDNYGRKGWHLDHIIPLNSFDLSNIIEFKKACHYTNLQPLWWYDNMSKGAKIN